MASPSSSKSSNMPDHIFKVVLAGSGGAGKSSMLLRWCENKFLEEYAATIGVEFGGRTIELPYGRIKLQLWDLAGAKSFQAITAAYYRGTVAGLLVFDLSQQGSWDEIATLVEAYRNQAATNAAIYIIGAKCDLISTRAVDLATILAFCQKEEVSYFEVSAKNGFNMEPLLETLVNDIYTIQVACLSASPKLALASDGEFMFSARRGKEAADYDFSELLKTGQFSDLDFVHAHSDYRIRVHSGLLALYGITETEKAALEDQKIDRETLHKFISSLYGSVEAGKLPTVAKPSSQGLESPSSPQISISTSYAAPQTSSTLPTPINAPTILGPEAILKQCKELVQLRLLYGSIDLKSAEDWADCALKELYLPFLPVQELVALLLFTIDLCDNNQLLELIFEALHKFQGEVLEMASSNEEFRALASNSPSIFGLIFLKMGSAVIAASPSVYHQVPNFPESLRSKLSGTLLQHAQTPFGRAEMHLLRTFLQEETFRRSMDDLVSLLPLASDPSLPPAGSEIELNPLDELMMSSAPSATSSEPQNKDKFTDASSSSSLTQFNPRKEHSSSTYGVSAPSAPKEGGPLDGNLIIEIDGYGASTRAVAHDWVLFMRWPWMRTLLKSGLVESRERKVVLPRYFPPYLLSMVLSYFYGSPPKAAFEVKMAPEIELARVSACAFVLGGGAEFGFCAIDEASSAHAINPLPGFDHLVSFCKLSTLRKLTLANCLEQLRIYASDEAFAVQLQKAVEFVAAQAGTLVLTPENQATIDRTPEWVWKQIFLARMINLPSSQLDAKRA